ncbi:MAG: phosphoenolpyruvate carboxykinase (ATP) [Clostridia bacterium]|nr:phosphoenolpyruvate carboxykinase (ATP) [Clostridia bacterium]
MSTMDLLGLRREQLKEGYSVCRLINEAVARGEGRLTREGALLIETGQYTGRSPKDRFIVRDEVTKETVAYGKTNLPMDEEVYQNLLQKTKEYMREKELYLVKALAGSSDKYALKINVLCEDAAQAAFSSQIFIKDNEREDLDADFTVVALPNLKAEGEKDGIHSEAFIIISFRDRLVLIGGTKYSGEIKKSVFSVMNYLLPEEGVLPMHCSANMGNDGKTALFFGLSGTGKTTLSADPKRLLIGDDEHGWSEEGIFNFEGGCYAKCINLDAEKEKEIYEAIRFGTVLENVVVNDKGEADYCDNVLTENTRCTYPLEYIEHRVDEKKGGHPSTILFLTADAFGVIPPVSRLTREGAMYHFMSGYTSKLAGTERGIVNPETTFSALFGEPFMPREIETYAQLLGEMIDQHETEVYLINTGWSGGVYGVGQRTPLKYTRLMVDAALNGDFRDVEFVHDEIFNLDIPVKVPGVPDEILIPKNLWKDPLECEKVAMELSGKFKENFHRFRDVSENITQAGPY